MIIGIVAAIAIPNMLTALERSKQKRSMADMRTIATAWEARAVDLNTYGISGQSVPVPFDWLPNEVTADSLSRIVSPTYIRQMPRQDGWGNAYDFSRDSKGEQYGIRSAGRDGRFDGTHYILGGTENFDCDIVYTNGTFIRYPEGVQVQ